MTQKLPVTLKIAKQLVSTQFPDFMPLKIQEMSHKGRDNFSYRLGDEMLIRLPSNGDYVAKVSMEHRWLPHLRTHLSLPVPRPLYLGRASDVYPFPWSIYEWIEGEVLCGLSLSSEEEHRFAHDIGGFLNDLHAVPTADAPGPGEHNFYRGGDLAAYDADVQWHFTQLEEKIDVASARLLWSEALSTTWSAAPVWVHGDMACGNILMQDNALAAVIDFGGMCVGDPACDLVLAWTYFSPVARNQFIKALTLDDATWTRAKAWCLWKAMYEYCTSPGDLAYQCRQLAVIEAVLS